jgi:carbon starvation protein
MRLYLQSQVYGVLWVYKGVSGVVWLRVAAFKEINSIYILTAALCSYAIGYRFYSKWIAARVLMLDDRRATPVRSA